MNNARDTREYKALQTAYAFFNKMFFKGELPEVFFLFDYHVKRARGFFAPEKMIVEVTDDEYNKIVMSNYNYKPVDSVNDEGTDEFYDQIEENYRNMIGFFKRVLDQAHIFFDTNDEENVFYLDKKLTISDQDRIKDIVQGYNIAFNNGDPDLEGVDHYNVYFYNTEEKYIIKLALEDWINIK